MVKETEKKVKPSKPHFFKVLLGDFNRRLRIPPAFVKYIPNNPSNRAILKGPGGYQWPVTVSHGGLDSTYFMRGWAKFAKDHRLHQSDFLLFRYHGGMHFSVRIFDKTACERDDALLVRSNKEHGQVEEKTKKSKKLAFSSEFPFFIKCMTKRSIGKGGIVHIPKSFIHEQFRRTTFTLMDSMGRKWKVKITPVNGITTGWVEFRRANKLKKGDNCVFELVNKDTFYVHVV